MYIEKIRIENFRLLKNCVLDMRDKTTLLVGKNNTGKTSLVALLEKFLEKPDSFVYDDFPLSIRERLSNINEDSNLDELSIRLVLKISYSEIDDIEALSEFMLDLDSSRRDVNILIESKVDRPKLLKDFPAVLGERRRFLEKNLNSKYLKTSIYAFDDFGYEGNVPYYLEKRDQLEEKERIDLKRLLSFQVIHARRNVASSEDGSRGTKPLSSISTKFFQKQDEADSGNLDGLRSSLAKIDRQLDSQYEEVFKNFLKSSGNFLDLKQLKVVSNIQSRALIENSSQVIYGESDNSLPEQQTGLGYLNILYLLLQIEIRQAEFAKNVTPLNLLIIEEPEAHTHPQMQYVFANKIRDLIETIPNLQAILTTHSSHIVAKSEFEDIRYLSKSQCESNITIKNFHTELKQMYEKDDEGKKLFKFLKQYLTINSAELFFASKAIFIEGTTERILLPWFIKVHDDAMEEKDESGKLMTGLSSQNITVLEVGANAKAFAPFLDFMDIKTLVITDIDTIKPKITNKSKKYSAEPVETSTHTSNATLKYFFKAPLFDDLSYQEWHKNLLKGMLVPDKDNVFLAYQKKENGYHARSFEDAFICLNIQVIENEYNNLAGLQNVSELCGAEEYDFYELTNKLIAKKSDFASAVLFSALTGETKWDVPAYIKDGLKWLQKN